MERKPHDLLREERGGSGAAPPKSQAKSNITKSCFISSCKCQTSGRISFRISSASLPRLHPLTRRIRIFICASIKSSCACLCLSQLVSALGAVMNRIILHQDRRVVVTQLPKKSDFKMKENLVQGDLPILEFRKRREQLKEKVSPASLQ